VGRPFTAGEIVVFDTACLRITCQDLKLSTGKSTGSHAVSLPALWILYCTICVHKSYKAQYLSTNCMAIAYLSSPMRSHLCLFSLWEYSLDHYMCHMPNTYQGGTTLLPTGNMTPLISSFCYQYSKPSTECFFSIHHRPLCQQTTASVL